MKKYNWATLGCGVIANQLAEAMISRGDSLYSVANRTHEKALEFAEKYGIKKVYDKIEDVFEDENVDIIYISTPHNTHIEYLRNHEKALEFAEKYGIKKVYDKIEDVFEDENVDIIYISTPHNTHIEYLRKALKAGKHVLCEKSITLNSDELNEAISLAEENHVILAEAMTIFHMPIYKELNKIIESGKLGDLKLIQMNFGSYKEYDMTNRFFNKNLAGGAMLDIGVYALSFVRWFMSSKPTEILSQVKYAPTGVDEQASILLKNKEEEMATVIR